MKPGRVINSAIINGTQSVNGRAFIRAGTTLDQLEAERHEDQGVGYIVNWANSAVARAINAGMPDFRSDRLPKLDNRTIYDALKQMGAPGGRAIEIFDVGMEAHPLQGLHLRMRQLTADAKKRFGVDLFPSNTFLITDRSNAPEEILGFVEYDQYNPGGPALIADPTLTKYRLVE